MELHKKLLILSFKLILLFNGLIFSTIVKADLAFPNEMTEAFGGGFGGNKITGQLIYDGLPGHLSKLNIMRDTIHKICYMYNTEVVVKDYSNRQIPSFSCENVNPEHNFVYWNGSFHSHLGGSPDNDALFSGTTTKAMYKDWYGESVITSPDGKPWILTMVVHAPFDNIFWNGKELILGDIESLPINLLKFVAHELSQGFTFQHSNVFFGPIAEAFSDMGAEAVEYYAYGKNNWRTGAGYDMDQPSRGCNGRQPGDNCPIDKASQYYPGLDAYYASGVYNRLFYLLATTQDWTVRKAFAVMLRANRDYWTPKTTFLTGVCAMLAASKDLGYSKDDVIAAAKGVDIDASRC